MIACLIAFIVSFNILVEINLWVIYPYLLEFFSNYYYDYYDYLSTFCSHGLLHLLSLPSSLFPSFFEQNSSNYSNHVDSNNEIESSIIVTAVTIISTTSTTMNTRTTTTSTTTLIFLQRKGIRNKIFKAIISIKN